MSFLSRAARLVDSRVFSSTGLSDVWITNGFEVPAILNEQLVEDEGVYLTELTLDVLATEVNKFTVGNLIYRPVDNATYKVVRIGKVVDGSAEILLGDQNA